MAKIKVMYQVTCPAEEVERVAREIAVEQTVEVPEELLTTADIRERIVAKIVSIEQLNGMDDCFAVTLEFNSELASSQLPQLLNLIYGNVSIKNNICLVDLLLPDELLQHFRGPNFGSEGLHALLGVYDRPLLATALKPRGLSAQQLAAMASEFALGGGDIVKDDHNLVDASFEEFQQRVTLCRRAVEKANAQTGRACLYFPNICAPVDQLDRYLDFLVSNGISGILIAPMVLGLDVVRQVTESRQAFIVMTHPTFSGTFFHDTRHGIEPGIFLGTLFRLAGVDVSIFPNFGGRFAFTREQCASVAHHLRSPLGNLRPAMPAPAGGMKFQNISEMAAQYGPDAVFLVGGALLSHGESLRESTAVLMKSINQHFKGRLIEPQEVEALTTFISACETPVTINPEKAIIEHLPFEPNFRWKDRTPLEYKTSDELPFKDITRHELLGRFSETAAFDLRYFEIGPGGYSSREKHMHTHAIIGVRGQGVLKIGDRQYELKPFDIAHVPPRAVHQFLNESREEPFGFFCIVDHQRDRPTPP